MLDDFLIRALVAGIGIALITGPMGCFIVWRRMAYFGDTMAHSALLGIALGTFFDINLTIAVFMTTLLIATLLWQLQNNRGLPLDSLLGILSHASLALGLVFISLFVWLKIDLISFLFGDILTVQWFDIALIYGTIIIVFIFLVANWRALLANTIHEELAAAEGLHPQRTRFLFMIMMAAIISVAMKLIGILLITALLIIPAAAARRLSHTPEQMAVLSSIIGVLAVIGGLSGSAQLDTPAGPSIVVAALILFIAGLIPFRSKRNP